MCRVSRAGEGEQGGGGQRERSAAGAPAPSLVAPVVCKRGRESERQGRLAAALGADGRGTMEWLCRGWCSSRRGVLPRQLRGRADDAPRGTSIPPDLNPSVVKRRRRARKRSSRRWRAAGRGRSKTSGSEGGEDAEAERKPSVRCDRSHVKAAERELAQARRRLGWASAGHRRQGGTSSE